MHDNTLYILWTNADLITSEKMVFMYGQNSKTRGWWENVTLIIWGATTKLVSENRDIQKRLKEMMQDGVHVSACVSCAEQLGVKDDLAALGVELIKWGVPLTEILKSGGKLLTV